MALDVESRSKLLPIGCRFVPHDQYLLTHLDPAWRIHNVKSYLLHKCLGTPFTPPPPSATLEPRRPASPITFAPDPRKKPPSPIEFARRKDRRGWWGEEEEEVDSEEEEEEREGGKDGWVEDVDGPQGGLVAGGIGESHRAPFLARNVSTNESSSSASFARTPSTTTRQRVGEGGGRPDSSPSTCAPSTSSFTLIRYSTLQLLEDDFRLADYNFTPFELLEMHGSLGDSFSESALVGVVVPFSASNTSYPTSRKPHHQRTASEMLLYGASASALGASSTHHHSHSNSESILPNNTTRPTIPTTTKPKVPIPKPKPRLTPLPRSPSPPFSLEKPPSVARYAQPYFEGWVRALRVVWRDAGDVYGFGLSGAYQYEVFVKERERKEKERKEREKANAKRRVNEVPTSTSTTINAFLSPSTPSTPPPSSPPATTAFPSSISNAKEQRKRDFRAARSFAYGVYPSDAIMGSSALGTFHVDGGAGDGGDRFMDDGDADVDEEVEVGNAKPYAAKRGSRKLALSLGRGGQSDDDEVSNLKEDATVKERDRDRERRHHAMRMHGPDGSSMHLEWRDRWITIRDGMVNICKDREDTKPTHRLPLTALTAIRGAEHLAISTQHGNNNKKGKKQNEGSLFPHDPLNEEKPANLRFDKTYIPKSKDDAERVGMRIVCARFKASSRHSGSAHARQRSTVVDPIPPPPPPPPPPLPPARRGSLRPPNLDSKPQPKPALRKASFSGFGVTNQASSKSSLFSKDNKSKDLSLRDGNETAASSEISVPGVKSAKALGKQKVAATPATSDDDGNVASVVGGRNKLFGKLQSSPPRPEKHSSSGGHTSDEDEDSESSSSLLSSPIFAHSDLDESDDSILGAGIPRASYRYGYEQRTQNNAKNANPSDVTPSLERRSLDNMKNKQPDRSGVNASEEDARREYKQKGNARAKDAEKGDWIVLDMGSDAAFSSFLRILHRHFPRPIVSSFVSPSPPIVFATSTPQDLDSFTSTRKADHPSALLSFRPADSSHKAFGALPYPEWRLDLVKSAQIAGIGEVGKAMGYLRWGDEYRGNSGKGTDGVPEPVPDVAPERKPVYSSNTRSSVSGEESSDDGSDVVMEVSGSDDEKSEIEWLGWMTDLHRQGVVQDKQRRSRLQLLQHGEEERTPQTLQGDLRRYERWRRLMDPTGIITANPPDEPGSPTFSDLQYMSTSPLSSINDLSPPQLSRRNRYLRQSISMQDEQLRRHPSDFPARRPSVPILSAEQTFTLSGGYGATVRPRLREKSSVLTTAKSTSSFRFPSPTETSVDSLPTTSSSAPKIYRSVNEGGSIGRSPSVLSKGGLLRKKESGIEERNTLANAKEPNTLQRPKLSVATSPAFASSNSESFSPEIKSPSRSATKSFIRRVRSGSSLKSGDEESQVGEASLPKKTKGRITNMGNFVRNFVQ